MQWNTRAVSPITPAGDSAVHCECEGLPKQSFDSKENQVMAPYSTVQ